MDADVLSGGFEDAPRAAARAFRTILDAMAHPGRIVTLAGAAPPAPLSVAAGVAILALIDRTTPLWLAPSHDVGAVRDWVTFHTGAPFVGPEAAVFALGDWAGMVPLSRFATGTAEYPDRSATLIVEMADLCALGARLTGPGIETVAALNLPDPAAFAINRAHAPLGLDLIFTAGARMAALPRSTRVEGV